MKQPRGVDGAAGTILAASRDERIARAVELHRQGLSQREIGLELGVTQVSAGRFLRAAGVATNPCGARPKYPAPEPRACEHCETVFTPAYPSLAVEPHGRFCSEPCRVDGLRKHEKVGERTCANVNCGRAFTPHPGNVQRGRGTYCSEQCSYRSETRRAKIAAVAQTSTAEAWTRGEGIARGKVERAEGRTRQRWLGRWAMLNPKNRALAVEAGIDAGRGAGGRPSKLNGEQQVQILELDRRGMSTREIAREVLGDESLHLRVWRFLRR
jgi:transposase